MRGAWFLLLLVASAQPASADTMRVADRIQYERATRDLSSGDMILLADGTWRDFTVRLHGRGTAGKPIILAAEHPGKVILTGHSSLRLAGRYLQIRGLVFRDGAAPGKELIAFRDGKDWAEDSRITEIVVDGFNPLAKSAEDHWVALYGQHNRVDHSHFVGKANDGATMVVVRVAGMPLDNQHRVDHNYFGPRPPLGKNGGETIRIGTSTESGSDSHTIVEDNWFDRCDGEIEIVSVKSGGNVIRRNVFAESRGAVTLRHGDGNLVENNIFLGHGVRGTGGVRVINRHQVVRGNYMQGLAGSGFASAITVMNGVPNSPINRYVPVDDALIENNSVIEASRITLAAGADQERTVAPKNVRFVANLIVNRGVAPFRAEGDAGGVGFERNVQQAGKAGPLSLTGDRKAVALRRAVNGLLYPADPALAAIGAPRDLRPIAREATGAAWYPKPAAVHTNPAEAK